MEDNREYGDLMITKEELIKLRKLKGLDLEQVEKDYLLEIALSIISRETKNELVFKGGTCLYKFHKLNRFSEDLDFSASAAIEHGVLFDGLVSGFSDYGVKAILKPTRQPFNSVLASLQMQGPLFDGNPRSLASIRIDINLKSEVDMPPVAQTLYSDYRDIIPFQVLCMTKEEIASEKIRAIITRDKARDVYDLWFLMRNGTRLDPDLLEKKMAYYGMGFDLKEFTSRLEDKKAGWEEDLSRLVFGPLPTFENARKDILMILEA